MRFAARLYLLRQPDRRLLDLGAPQKPGTVFEAYGPLPDIVHAVIARRVAVVDPPPYWLLYPLWWSLQREPGTDFYAGPPLWIDDSGFALQAPAADGLPLGLAVRAALLRAPGAITLPRRPSQHRRTSPLGLALLQLLEAEPVLEQLHYRHVEPFVRRTVPAPTSVSNLDTWLAQAKALPSPAALAAWYANLIAEHLFRVMVNRFVMQLIAGELVAQIDGDRVPSSFWQAPVKVDLEHGALLTPFDVELYRGLQVYLAAAAPVAKTVHTNGDRHPGLRGQRSSAQPRISRPPANRAWGWHGGRAVG